MDDHIMLMLMLIGTKKGNKTEETSWHKPFITHTSWFLKLYKKVQPNTSKINRTATKGHGFSSRNTINNVRFCFLYPTLLSSKLQYKTGQSQRFLFWVVIWKLKPDPETAPILVSKDIQQ